MMRVPINLSCATYVACVLAALPFLTASAAVNLTLPKCTGLDALSPQCKPVEASHRREVFYVGGHYELNAQTKQNVLVDKMYVEKLTPVPKVSKPYPLVFFHGGGFSGTVSQNDKLALMSALNMFRIQAWLQTPDNRKGFMSHFLELGYQVYLLDQTSVGRSTQPDQTSYPTVGVSTAEGIIRGFTRMEDYNDYPQAKLHTQWPGTGTFGDPSFDALSGLALPLTTASQRQESSMRSAGCALLAIIGKSFLISHSIGAAFPILLSDQCPDLVAGSLNLEPTTIPFETIIGSITSPNAGRAPSRQWGLANTPLTYDPAPATPADLKTVRIGVDTAGNRSCLQQADPPRRLTNIARVPYVALTGEASQHTTFDHCIVNYLRQAGGSPEWIRLWDIGIKGNGHFGYLEKNSDEYAKVAEMWLSKVSAGPLLRSTTS